MNPVVAAVSALRPGEPFRLWASVPGRPVNLDDLGNLTFENPEVTVPSRDEVAAEMDRQARAPVEAVESWRAHVRDIRAEAAAANSVVALRAQVAALADAVLGTEQAEVEVRPKGKS